MWEAMKYHLLLSWDIHPHPCPRCGTRSLERGEWICWECGHDRDPQKGTEMTETNETAVPSGKPLDQAKPAEFAEGETAVFYIEIATWVNGEPKTIRTIPAILSKELGMGILSNIGKSKFYDLDYAGFLFDGDGKRIGQLNIYYNSWNVVDLEDESEPTPKVHEKWMAKP